MADFDKYWQAVDRRHRQSIRQCSGAEVKRRWMHTSGVAIPLADSCYLQFGKVAFNTYILDFQPGSICAAQAFAIALSAFNKGFSP